MSEQIEGRNAVLEAFRSGKCVDKLFVLDRCQDGPVRTIIREARKKDTIINFVQKERLDQLSETGAHQGVIAQVAAYEYSDALAQTLHYAENDAKTKLNESAKLVTGIHCRANHAWEDMRAVQERFGKTDGVVALHAYQSFREGEVTPEQCHEIGVALARKVWGKRFQVLVATHMNTDNLHNHFPHSSKGEKKAPDRTEPG